MAVLLNKEFTAIRNRQRERFDFFNQIGNVSTRIFHSPEFYQEPESILDYQEAKKSLARLKVQTYEWMDQNIMGPVRME